MAGQDPALDQVTLLIPFEGAEDYAISDISPTPLAVTNSGTVQKKRAASRDGLGAGYFDGTNYLTTESAAFAFGTADFTIECWINLLTATSSWPFILQSSPYNSGAGFYLMAQGDGTGWGGVGQVEFYGATTLTNLPILNGSTAVRGEGWTHIAVTRQGADSKLWINGVLDASHTAAGTADFSPSFANIMTQSNGAYKEKGYMQDLRVTIGTARYAANFTPPGRFSAMSFPDLRPGAAALSGVATDSTGAAVDLIAVRHMDTKGVAALVVPGETGAWSADVPPGDYEVTAFVDGCQPFSHAPYTVSE